ncbi:hypothetical protein EUGRSUZ_C00413 [Eucalyptus grandis]|uniref:Uncharacterized protein n=2 Tax=Eucalyptus grandis TaxID=71139 RepID=A0ACC3L9M2_EUCGR|nr:hypothetical protein EUGRSUZ_C00413 [Eucalyptus grandis]
MQLSGISYVHCTAAAEKQLIDENNASTSQALRLRCWNDSRFRNVLPISSAFHKFGKTIFLDSLLLYFCL